jgi:hypothetical protein
MHCIGRLAVAALIVFALASARAAEPLRPPHPGPSAAHACLDLKERRAANESGQIVHLAVAMRAAKKRMPGTVIRARLCHGKDGLVYVLTILGRDGKVGRWSVDAVKGTLLGKR